MDPIDIKIDTSPTGNHRFSFSRTNSTGSIPAGGCTSSASSAHNTDDEDSDTSRTHTLNYKERRREAHTVAEQKRRDAIKKGYDELMTIVPTCHQQDALSPPKMSKATVLQKSIDYMQFLTQQKKKQEDELESLRKEVMALKIMKANYEHIVKTHQNTPQHGQNQVSDEMKFQVFKQIMDSLFQSFNSSISVANFAELSACVFSWLEEYCKPQIGNFDLCMKATTEVAKKVEKWISTSDRCSLRLEEIQRLMQTCVITPIRQKRLEEIQMLMQTCVITPIHQNLQYCPEVALSDEKARPNRPKCSETVTQQTRQNWSEMQQTRQNWSEMQQTRQNWSETQQNHQNWSERVPQTNAQARPETSAWQEPRTQLNMGAWPHRISEEKRLCGDENEDYASSDRRLAFTSPLDHTYSRVSR